SQSVLGLANPLGVRRKRTPTALATVKRAGWTESDRLEAIAWRYSDIFFCTSLYVEQEPYLLRGADICAHFDRC
ncbi:MAG: hypothetical protein ACFB0G_25515, partial [Leptolyngbyaceae cyanobacterium]